jgi:hypothetical protein
MWQQAHESKETHAKPGWPVLWGPEAGKGFSIYAHSGRSLLGHTVHVTIIDEFLCELDVRLVMQTTHVILNIWYLNAFFCEVFNNLRLNLELI